MVPACRGIPGFTHTILSQTAQHAQRKYFETALNASYLGNDQCKSSFKELTCATFLRPCVDNGDALLCQDRCLKTLNVCQSSFPREEACGELPKRGGDTSLDSVICKVKHWPLASNWHLPDDQIAPSVTPSVTPPVTPPITPSLGKAGPAFCCFQIVCLFVCLFNVVVIWCFFFLRGMWLRNNL